MSRIRQKHDLKWKKHFGILLRNIFNAYELDYSAFSEEYSWSTSTIRYWFIGRSLPHRDALSNLKVYFSEHIKNQNPHNMQMAAQIKNIFLQENNTAIYFKLKRLYSDFGEFVGETLTVIYELAKNNSSILNLADENECLSSGNTQAVIFDFDGTLTIGKTNRTTWERLWLSLGYKVQQCQELHMKFDRKEITHAQWCKLTEEKFRERSLHKRVLQEIAEKITLIDGIKETFEELTAKNIKIYIVSGSIDTIIHCALGDLKKYVEETKANHFKFNREGYLYEIVGTKYDFEGKADFISQIATDLNISPNDILFVGNSSNDRFAYSSGAKTLCINPKLTDTTNRTVWNDCIPTCENLTEILQYIKSDDL